MIFRVGTQGNKINLVESAKKMFFYINTYTFRCLKPLSNELKSIFKSEVLMLFEHGLSRLKPLSNEQKKKHVLILRFTCCLNVGYMTIPKMICLHDNVAWNDVFANAFVCKNLV